jgi:hypothetical protein
MKLGQVNYIDDIRTVWVNEAKDFTPWLAENINTLGAELGLDIELITTEHGIGSFSLDIYAKEINTGHSIVIENQLEATDHSHLGQLIPTPQARMRRSSFGFPRRSGKSIVKQLTGLIKCRMKRHISLL